MPEPNRPIKFLNSTVYSLSASLGLGSTSESSLSLELVDDDCNSEQFYPFQFRNSAGGAYNVGAPVIFPDSAPDGFNFGFGGILQSWTYNEGAGGRTYKCTITDPRQLLENAVVIIDSYIDLPPQTINYFNVYNQGEGQILLGNCAVFGATYSNERGMPYYSIVQQLYRINQGSSYLSIYAPEGQEYLFNLDDINSLPIPPTYRVPGPSITILQLIQDVCDTLGLQFYSFLDYPNIIRIGYVNYAQPPGSVMGNIASYAGYSTDLSYGQELRNDKTRTMIIGEQQHYLTGSDIFSFFFGEDIDYTTGYPYAVVPFAYTSNNGFWILKQIFELNQTLYFPLDLFGLYGPYTISEWDIRAAMASYDLWIQRVFSPNIPGTFNAAIRYNSLRLGGTTGGDDCISCVLNNAPSDVDNQQFARAYIDMHLNPTRTQQQFQNTFFLDLQAAHEFVKSLGDTYYGKAFFTRLNQTICAKVPTVDEPFGQLIFTDLPTNEGGWVDPNVPILGLYPPEIDLFKETDGRVGAFFGFYDPQIPVYPNPEPAPPPSPGS